MKYKAEFELPDNASWQEIEDAKLSVKWHRILSQDERMSGTNLKGKCGGCVYFVQEKRLLGCSANGECLKGYVYRKRSNPACKRHYKERDDL